MNLKDLQETEIQDFIADHINDDIAQLALKKSPNPDWNYGAILDQIKSRQKAKKKIPSWVENFGLIMPPPDIIEQASSSATAAYKSNIKNGKCFVDLCAGSGCDSVAFMQSFQEGICIEHDKFLAKILRHNLKSLTTKPIHVFNQDAQNFVQDMPIADLVYIDPQRRDGRRRGIYELVDCSPDIISLIPILQTKTKHILLKTSPILDIKKTILDLKYASEIHIVQYQKECKEVLYLLDLKKLNNNPEIIAADIDDFGRTLKSIRFNFETEHSLDIQFAQTKKYLYEPGPAFQKAGCYASLAKKFNIEKLHPNTHLFTSDSLVSGFPGRTFEIMCTLPIDKKQIKKYLPEQRANLTIRNFPMRTEDLRKKLGIQEGGHKTLFAFTDSKNKKSLILCTPIAKS